MIDSLIKQKTIYIYYVDKLNIQHVIDK
jgi:hypothetical protein